MERTFTFIVVLWMTFEADVTCFRMGKTANNLAPDYDPSTHTGPDGDIHTVFNAARSPLLHFPVGCRVDVSGPSHWYIKFLLESTQEIKMLPWQLWRIGDITIVLAIRVSPDWAERTKTKGLNPIIFLEKVNHAWHGFRWRLSWDTQTFNQSTIHFEDSADTFCTA